MYEYNTLVDIKGYEGLYAITPDGRVLQWPRTWHAGLGLKQLRKRGFKWAYTWVTTNGYRQVRLCKDGGARNFSIHRLIASRFISNPLDKATVNHKDGDKLNNRRFYQKHKRLQTESISTSELEVTVNENSNHITTELNVEATA